MATTYAIPDGRVAMAATLYTGTGASLAVANTVNGVNFQPDLVWVKGRSGATDHAWYDVVRGVQLQLESNTTIAETTETTGLTAFGSTGFTVGALAQMNTSAATYVAWQWKAGGTAVTNTAGSITSSVSANTTAGFSVATYTAPSGTFTFGHGLGVTPNFVIIKRRDGTSNWNVWTTGFTARQSAYLDATNGADSAGADWFAVNSSTVQITTGQFTGTGNYVAYCFAAVPGYSAFGRYTGNGSADGPFVYLGFRPRFIMIKRTDTAGYHWGIWDTSVNTYNLEQLSLYADSSSAEINATDLAFDGLSNGFKLRGTSLGVNASGGTYIYMAFAENPTKFANAR